MILTQVIHDVATNSVEATWVNGSGKQVKCHSYADVQMDMLEADLGADLPEYADLIASVRAAIVPYIAPIPPIPQDVTRRQAKQALLITGKLSLVQPAINAIPDATQRGLIQIEWDDSQEFQRNRSSVIAIGTAIGLTSDGLDDLFVQAATL